MATTHAPAFQSHTWTFPLDTASVIKAEKLLPVLDDDAEYSKWFNADSFPSSATSTQSNMSNSSSSSLSSQQAQQIASAISQVSSSAVYTQPLNFNTSSSSPSVTLPVSNFNTQGFSGVPFALGYTSQSTQHGMNQSPTVNLIQLPVAGSQSNGSSQLAPQMIVLPNFGFSQQQQLTVNPQFYSFMLTQFQSLKNPPSPSSSDDSSDERKKRGQKGNQRRIRQTRPKVVEAKGAVQCAGRNRKKNCQCRNAALMEYIGPRPIYCAEHIELDPNSLYEKCKSPFQKEVDDKKGCKEVVLKEFGLCYKHYGASVAELVANRDIQTARMHYDRILELLDQLEREANAAKKKDGDLYQRKNKLIPKFQEMKKIIAKGLEELQFTEVEALSSELNTPVLKLTHNANVEPQIDYHALAPNVTAAPNINDFDNAKILEQLS